MIKTIVSVLLLASLAFCQSTFPPGEVRPCGEVQCSYERVPMGEIAVIFGILVPFDKVLITTGAADQNVRAFEVTLRYRWKGQPAQSEHVMQKMPEGVGYLHVFFFDMTEIEVESINIRQLVRRTQ